MKARTKLITLVYMAQHINAVNDTPEHYEDAIKVSTHIKEYDGKKYYQVTRFEGEYVIKNCMTTRECKTFLQGMLEMARIHKI